MTKPGTTPSDHAAARLRIPHSVSVDPDQVAQGVAGAIADATSEARAVVHRRLANLSDHLCAARDMLYIDAGAAYDDLEHAQRLAASMLDILPALVHGLAHHEPEASAVDGSVPQLPTLSAQTPAGTNDATAPPARSLEQSLQERPRVAPRPSQNGDASVCELIESAS